MSLDLRRCEIWFDDPDSAYLAAAAIRRYANGLTLSDVDVIPSRRGPTLEMSADAASTPVIRALVKRFSGHVVATRNPTPGRSGPAC